MKNKTNKLNNIAAGVSCLLLLALASAAHIMSFRTHLQYFVPETTATDTTVSNTTNLLVKEGTQQATTTDSDATLPIVANTTNLVVKDLRERTEPQPTIVSGTTVPNATYLVVKEVQEKTQPQATKTDSGIVMPLMANTTSLVVKELQEKPEPQATIVSDTPWPIVAHTTNLVVKEMREKTQHEQVDLVVSFVGASYLDVLRIWLHYYTRSHHPHRVLCLIALDEVGFDKLLRIHTATPELFGEKVVITKMIPKSKSRGDLWAERMKFLNILLQELPHNVLFSDLDALWLKDPQIIIDQQKNSDIVASRGTWPERCPLHQRDTICFGFSYFRNTAALRDLLRKQVNDIEEKGADKFDDQKAFNCMIKWKYRLLKAEEKSPMSTKELRYKKNLTVSLLPYAEVIRHCRKSPAAVKNASVAHCLTYGKKLVVFDAMDLLPAELKNISSDPLWSNER